MTMMGRYVYFYLMNADRDRAATVVPEHMAHWNGRCLPGYSGGPFDDRSGGMITFEADDLAAAQQLVDGDPFVQGDLLAAHWLKRWVPG